jgi:uncharacterized protein YjbI with pentapeptide repeats
MSRTYTKEELQKIVDDHGKWCRGEADGTWANLSQANLYGANLDGANLSRANLSRANLSQANLSQANLSRANLSQANLSQANLSRANLSRANLSRANLYGANLDGANLSRANLSRANLSQANLEKAVGLNRNVLPEEGEFIAYKKVQSSGGKRVLVLCVPEYAGRVTPYTDRKSRVSHATPIRAEMLDGTPAAETSFWSMHDEGFRYELGKEASVPDYVDSKLEVCTRGIHVFASRKEAQEYSY